MDDIIISVEHVSKDFRLPQEKTGTLKAAFTNILKIRNRTIKTQHALQDVSFEIRRGEFFGIVGRNGSGKSTLLKMLAGIYQPTKGKIQVNGKLVPFIELGVGFNPELTGRQNVYLNGAMLGFSEKEIDAQYADIVDFAELEEFMDQKLKNYSSGMQVRLAFSMAVRAKSDILLVDEVLAVGDADFKRKCFEYFKQLKKDKITVVFVSHDMGAIQEYCDRVALIDENQLKQVGPANNIAEEYFKLFGGGNYFKKRKVGEVGRRWGDGRAEIRNISTKIDQKTLTIKYQIYANDNLDEIVAGFRIRGSDGTDVTGTNTKKERAPITGLQKGDSRYISWQVDNIFSDGTYFIDPSLVYSDEITVFDWWDEAASFAVHKNRTLPFYIDPGFRVSIKQN